MEGLFIPKEILKIQELTSTEKMVLSLYKYYTEKGTNKCCSLTKPQIADELNISTRYMKKIKSHLVDLGYIRTDGGIKVTYLGVQGDTRVSSNDVQGDTIVPPGGHQSVQGGTPECPVKDTIVSSKGTPECPHKKEKKEKNIKKEEKRELTNFDLLISKLPEDYKTQEKIDYIKEHFIDKINEQDFTEGGIIDMCIVQLKDVLNKKFPIEYKVTESLPKERSNTIDLF